MEQMMEIDGRLTHVPSEIAQKLDDLNAFRNEYCIRRGWNPSDLTTNQQLEIRNQPEWLAIENKR